MQPFQPAPMVSIHGGHSGQFCHHAADTLEDIIRAYRDQHFAWVGIAEHMPPADSRFIYPEERAAGLNIIDLQQRFKCYFETARQLQRRFQDELTLFVGFETEMYSGSLALAKSLRAAYDADYIVGSVHHVGDMIFDSSKAHYRRAAEAAGGIKALYCRYFDQQLEMIEAFRPEVVGHFDLIRIFDADYKERLKLPEVATRIDRNLKRIKALDLILDYNVRALHKGAEEPYVSQSILLRAKTYGLSLVPGDDSHSVLTAGAHIKTGIDILEKMAFSTKWRRPL